MTNCKQIPLPKVNNIDIHKLDFFFKLGNHLFETRYAHHAWKSFDLMREQKVSPMMKHFPFIQNWIDQCEKHTGFKKIKHCYISVVLPKNQIPWHVDMTNTDVFSPAALTSLVTDNSFIEFENDKKYTYKTGYSYLIKSGVKHRIMNLSDTNRYTLCVTPEENPYV
jgi:hypothetical protein